LYSIYTASEHYHLLAFNGEVMMNLPIVWALYLALQQNTSCRSAALVVSGVPVVLEQKTTILWKYLYLLASLKDSLGLGEA
jgi:hypothetical protein